FNDHPAGLRELYILGFVANVAEPVRANNGTGVNDYTISDFDVSINHYPGVYRGGLSDARVSPDVTTCFDNGVVSNYRPGFDHCRGADSDILSHDRIPGNHGRWMNNPRFGVPVTEQNVGGFRKSEFR